jgi:XRE family aerobic/anaerobic benzoate catabolism transcriptional regulator
MERTKGHLLRAFGQRIRHERRELGLSLLQLSERAGLSRRFLVEIEGGRGNPSLEKIAALALALHKPLRALCDLPIHPIPRRRVALLGIRGAGKSTVGPLLAQHLEVPFQELDQAIEDAAGMTTREIFELEGRGGFLRREAEALEQWLGKHGTGVLALPGSIVNHPQAYDRLLTTCTTIWLRASPVTHWNRVVAQGDTRPMAGNDQAMKHLVDLVEQRREAYERADFVLETTELSPEACVEAILGFLESQEAQVEA